MHNFEQFIHYSKKIVAAAINSKLTLKKNKGRVPENPIIFIKPTTSYVTEKECIKIPKRFSVSQEVELGVVISKTCSKIEAIDAMDVVAGYCVALDLNATCQIKEAANKGLPWFIGKGFDTACPVSRFILRNEINPCNTYLWSCVNGKRHSNGSTCDLFFSVPELISFISQYITLERYDLVLTGTPAGMTSIVPGDVIEGGIQDVVTVRFEVE